MKKYLLPLILLLAAPAFAAQQEITAVPDSPVLPSIGALKDAVNLRLSDIDENFDEIYPIIDAGPVYVNASAPADTKVVWIDTDQSNTIKVHIGGVWTAVGTAGSGDDLGSAAYSDVVALWTTCTGYLKSDGTCDTSAGLTSLPTADNQLLQATGAGTYAWTSTLEGIGNITGAGSYNNITVTQPATGATLTLVEGSTLATSGAYSTTLTATGATNVTLPTTGTLMATSDIGSTVQAYDADLTAWAAITPSTGNLETTGTIQGNIVFNSYDTAQTLTYANHNSSIVQMTVAGEVTMWDCETAGVGATVMLWARDAEKIEVVPASGDHFNLFDGTALTADYELDMAATAGTKVTLMCTADDTWSVYSETAASTDGGAAD